tara:strand:+ start:681 stop:1352 length:672 start_codon:yes stop_codon:yes gene_type:complete
MHQRKSKKVLLYFFLIIIFGSINNFNLYKLNLTQIKKINISGFEDTNSQNLLNEIKNLNLENLFFLNSSEITELIDSNTLVEKYTIFKKYPSTLDIKIKETTFLAKINLDGQLFLIGSNGKFTKKNTSNKNLPYIFGKPEIHEFLKFKKKLDNSKILYDQIKAFYYFQSKRWDIELKSNIIIKLPKDRIKESLDNSFKILNENSLNNIKIIDARVKNQIILNG